MRSADRLDEAEYGKSIVDGLGHLCRGEIADPKAIGPFLDDQFTPDIVAAAVKAGVKFDLRPEIAAQFIFMVRLRMWAAKTSLWSRLRSRRNRDVNLVYNAVGPAVSKLCEDYIAAHPGATKDFLSILLDELAADRPPVPSR